MALRLHGCYNLLMNKIPSHADGSDNKSGHVQAQALFLAIGSADSEAVIRLARSLIDLDLHKHGDFDDSPLIFAARVDLPLEPFQVLLERSNPLRSNSNGRSALMFAAMGREPHSPDLVRLLLPLSDPRAVDINGENALYFAIRAHAAHGLCRETIRALLPVSDLAQQKNGWTPLEHARARESDEAADLILSEIARREADQLSCATLPAKSKDSPRPRL